MRWQIAQFVFCDQQQTLTSEQGVQQLEPMVVELLSYFCQHSDQIIDKDELIEKVWLGRIVTDNAVSKLINKLRKAFDDDVRQPRFIATFPKKGYKFIAKAELLGEQEAATSDSNDVKVKELSSANSEDSATDKKQPKPFAGWLVASIFVVLVATILLTNSEQPSQPIASFAKAFTTDAGDEMFPSFSPDGTRVAYMSEGNGRIRLKVKNLLDGSVAEISHGPEMGVGPADWSPDGQSIVYLAATPDKCHYYIRKVEGINFGEPRLIHECPAGSYGKIAFTQHSHRLVYSESSGDNMAYVLYEINLETGNKKRLNQPDIYLGGNSQFDVHPFDNKLLISSPDKQQWEGFYSLDLDTDELQLLFKQDAYICCGIWSHSGDRVVLMGDYPAYQLISYDQSGQDAQAIYSGSRIIRWPRRHGNGVDYVFSSGENNINYSTLDLNNQREQVVANDSVHEVLAVFAHHDEHVAYISFASGSEEIWLKDNGNGQKRRLTQFNDSRHYIDLVWSPSGHFLAGLTLNEIHLVKIADGSYEKLAIPQIEMRGLSFKSDSVISYSAREGQQWRVFNYQITDKATVPEDPKWQYIQYRPVKEDVLWLDQDNNLYVGEDAQLVESPRVPANAMKNGRQFNLKKRGTEWYWFEWGNPSQIKRYSEASQTITTVKLTDVGHFDVKPEQTLLFGQIQYLNSDLYQTQVLE